MMMNHKGQFVAIRILFISLIFLLVFGILAKVVTESTEVYSNTWGDDYPILAFIMQTINIWIFLGFVLFALGSIAMGVVLGGT